MPVVFIQFTQDGVEFPVGNAEVSFDKMGLPVSCSLEDGTGVTSYLWSLIYKPEGSEAEIIDGGTATAAFTPDVEGTYMVQVVADELYTDAKYFGVKTQVFDTRIPYPGETVDDGATGWSEEVNTCLRKLSSVAGRTTIVCENIDAVDIEYGDVVISDGTLTALGRLGVYLATPALIASINPDIAMIGISTGDALTRGACEPLSSLNAAFYGGTVNGLTISGEAPLSYPWKVCLDPAVPGGLAYDTELSDSHMGYALDATTVALKSKAGLPISYQNVLYVGKHGSDDNDGRTPDKAFLTFAAAIVAAELLAPIVSNQIGIFGIDGGDYAESIIVTPFIFIIAPFARLSGSIVLSDDTHVVFERGAASTGVWCSKTTGTGAAHIEVKRLICTGGAHGIACLTGELEATFDRIEVADGVALGETVGGAAYMRATGKYVLKSGTPYAAVLAFNSGVIELNVSRIEIVGVTTAIMASTGAAAINGMVGDIVASGGTAINAGSGCSIYLLNAIYSGTITEVGTVRLMSAQNISRDNTMGGATPSNLLLPTQAAVEGFVASQVVAGVESQWDRDRQTKIDVSSLLLKVLPPDIFDAETGDTLPPPLPDGSSAYDTPIGFDLEDGNIGGYAPSGDWANEFPATAGARVLAKLFRVVATGVYKLLKGIEIIIGDACNHAGTTDYTSWTMKWLADVKRQQNSGGTIRFAGIYDMGGLLDAVSPQDFAVHVVKDNAGLPDMAHSLGRYPQSGYISIVNGGGATAVPGGDFAVDVETLANGEYFWILFESDVGFDHIYSTLVFDSPNFPSAADKRLLRSADGLNWLRVTAVGDRCISCRLKYVSAGAELEYPATPEGCEEVAVIGTLTHPFDEAATDTLVMSKYSQVAADDVSPAPAVNECPVCMYPPPKVSV